MDELVVAFNPVPAAERVAQRRNVFRSRVIMLLISVVLSVAVYVWQRQNFTGLGLGLLMAMNIVPAVWAVLAGVLWLNARRELAGLDDGTALVVHRGGVRVRDIDVPWRDLRSVVARPAAPGVSPLLVVTRTDATTLSVALDYLDRLPAEIDDAVRTFSQGRFAMETAGLGN